MYFFIMACNTASNDNRRISEKWTEVDNNNIVFRFSISIKSNNWYSKYEIIFQCGHEVCNACTNQLNELSFFTREPDNGVAQQLTNQEDFWYLEAAWHTSDPLKSKFYLNSKMPATVKMIFEQFKKKSKHLTFQLI